MGLGIGGLSLPQLPEIQELAELAVTVNAPLNTLAVCTKLAESLLHGVLIKDSLERKLAAVPPTDAFASLKKTHASADS